MLVAKVVCVADAAALIALILSNYQMAAVGLIVITAVPLYRLVAWRAEHYAINRADRRRVERAGRSEDRANTPAGSRPYQSLRGPHPK